MARKGQALPRLPGIVSGGGVELMRGFADTSHGVPPEQVVGSIRVTRFELLPNGRPVLIRDRKVLFIDDGPGKPEAINNFIGRVPVFAFGSSAAVDASKILPIMKHRLRALWQVRHTEPL